MHHLLYLIAVLVLLTGSLHTNASQANDRPNVILFLVDDLGWQDISLPLHDAPTALNHRYATPNLEALAARGMRFSDAYASAPVCTPTRTSIMTGISPGQSHITYWTLHADRDTSADHPTLEPPEWNTHGLERGQITLPSLLRDSGYRTIHVGKAHFSAHGATGADPRDLGFDVNIAGHASGGPASYYGTHNFSAAGKNNHDPPEPSVWDVPGLEKYHGEDIYLTDALTIEASAAIRDAVADDMPFFVNFAPYAVHTPIMPNRKLLDAKPTLAPTEAAYASMITTVDAALGTLVDLIDDLGITDNTMIIFTSDNGGLAAHARGPSPTGDTRHTHNAPLRSGKGSAYEGGVRVPMVIAGPGIGATHDRNTTPIVSHDLFPTILATAGITIPAAHVARVEGRDLTPLLHGDVLDERPLFFHQPHQWGASGPGIEPYTAVRLGAWKLIYFHADPRFELYNLNHDISELHDMMLERPDIARRLAHTMDKWIRTGDVQLSIRKATGTSIEMPGDVIDGWIGRAAAHRAMLAQATACVPTDRQLAWQRREVTAFVHFGINTFTDREWGTGREDAGIFNPSAFDADQWVRSCKAAGMSLVLLTAKHHDGFCLWPSAFTRHSVANSPWMDGQGDVVRAVADACRAHGLKFGIYLSPADLAEIESDRGRYGNNSPSVLSTIPSNASPDDRQFEFAVDDYNRYFLNQLYELLTGYGPVHEVWFDGANPKPGTGQTYSYDAWYALIRALAPEACIAIKGPDVRWVGNEAGDGRMSEWSVIPLDLPAEQAMWRDLPAPDLGSRSQISTARYFHWHPAETNTSIRPGWFYHASQDDQVKSLDHLMEIYDNSVGNNCCLLLNIPPDRRGLFHENDVERLRKFGDAIRSTYANNQTSGATARTDHGGAHAILDNDPGTFWTTPDGIEKTSIEIDLPEPRTINTAVLQEHLRSSQRVEAHAIDVWATDRWKQVARSTTIGARRILRFDAVITDRVRIRILESRIRPTLAEFGVYHDTSRP